MEIGILTYRDYIVIKESIKLFGLLPYSTPIIDLAGYLKNRDTH